MSADHPEAGRAAVHFVNLRDVLDPTDAFVPLAEITVLIRKRIFFALLFGRRLFAV